MLDRETFAALSLSQSAMERARGMIADATLGGVKHKGYSIIADSYAESVDQELRTAIGRVLVVVSNGVWHEAKDLSARCHELETALRAQGAANEQGEWHLDSCPWEDGCSPDCLVCRQALGRVEGQS